MEKKYIGIDYHKKYSQMVVMNQEGKIEDRVRVVSEKTEIQRYINGIEGEKEAVLEATRSWGKMYDILEEVTDRTYLAHPQKVKAIASAKIKTDDISAEVLAHLLRTDLLPTAYIPSKETRDKKNVLRQRLFFVRIQTMLKNRIHDLLDRNHIPQEELGAFSDLFGKQGMKYLLSLNLNPQDNSLLKQDLEFLEEVQGKIKASDGLVEEIAIADERIPWVKSIPGIGKFFSVLIVQEIDDINRFNAPKKLWSYAGIIPSTYSSGGKTYHGKITKLGNKHLRWAMIEAANRAISCNEDLKIYHHQVKKRKGSNAAKLAVARKLLEYVWFVLKEKRYFETRVKEKKELVAQVA